MPATGNSSATYRQSPSPKSVLKSVDALGNATEELNCRQATFSNRQVTKSISPKPFQPRKKSVVTPTPIHLDDEVAAPLRIHIKVKPRKASKTVANAAKPIAPQNSAVGPPNGSKPDVKQGGRTYFKSPTYEGHDDRWILQDPATMETLLQGLTPYQYASIEQRKNTTKNRQKSPTNVKLTPTCTSPLPSPPSNQSSNRSKSADSAPMNGVVFQGIPSRSRLETPVTTVDQEELMVDTHELLEQYRRMVTEGFDYPPAPSPIPPLTLEHIEVTLHPQKVLTLKGDGSIVSSDFFIQNENEVEKPPRQNESGYRWGLHSTTGAGTGITPPPLSASGKRKQKGCERCLSDTNILEIMENESSRFETFDTLNTGRCPQIRQPLMEMPEQRWQIRNQPTSSSGRASSNKSKPVTDKNTSKWTYGDEYIKFSEVLSDINDVKGVMMTSPSTKLRRPSSSPPSILRREVRIWEDGNERMTPSREKLSSKCEKSRSTSEIGRLKHATSEVIARIEKSQSKKKIKRPSSPRVAESKSLYDYRTLLI